MSSLIDELKRSIADGLTDRSLTSCSRWAANRRVMGEPFPGPYSWTYHPWVREMHDSSASFNYAMKSAQAGVTEVAINRALYVLDRLRRDVLYVLPTSLNASDFSKARFATALALSPKLAAIFTDTNTVNLKQAGTNSRGYFRLDVDVNLLLTSMMGGQTRNAYDIVQQAGVLLQAAGGPIPVLKFGDGPDDDQSLLG